MLHSFRLPRPRARTTVSLAMAAFALALTGCNDVPNDRLETAGPPGMPATSGAKAAPANPAAPLPPPTEADLGIPVYPHATTYADTAGMPVKPLTDSGMATAVLMTTDSVDQVVAFYKEHIMETDARGQRKPSTPSEEKTPNGQRQVTFIGNDAQRNVQMVEIRDEGGKTKIELMRTQAKSLPSGTSDTPESSAPTGTAQPSPATPSASQPPAGTGSPSGSGVLPR